MIFFEQLLDHSWIPSWIPWMLLDVLRKKVNPSYVVIESSQLRSRQNKCSASMGLLGA